MMFDVVIFAYSHSIAGIIALQVVNRNDRGVNSSPCQFKLVKSFFRKLSAVVTFSLLYQQNGGEFAVTATWEVALMLFGEQ